MGELVFEMLWDCRYCGSKKLLGLTHRHCPSCGAAQDPNGRYFPPEHEKVAVQNHEYVGADVVCRYCGAASSKKARNCGQCGAALSEGAPATPRSFLVEPTAFGGSTPPPRPLWKVLVPSLCLLAVAVVVTLMVWKKDEKLVVASRSWERVIDVERLGPTRESSWCDELPANAAGVTRRREQRGTTQVGDGEDCRVQKQDRGDGTFQETRVCTPKHKSEPAYAEKCEYTRVKWSRQRQERAEGTAAAAPHWPAVSMAAGCDAVGCEREGRRTERYTVVLKDAAGETYRCNVTENAWSGYAEGKSYGAKIRALGSLDCASLSPR